jgi:NTP pyrophosphatase (non-canonical NTP hydrolase)
MSLNLERLRFINAARAARWHKGGIESWSITDWSNAMAGEMGEACNAVKKLRRIEDEIANLSEADDRQLSSVEQAIDKIAEEVADTVIYGDLLLARLGASLEAALVKKFNEVSVRYGFPERL